MGRRSINTTKSGKYMNPTDQASTYFLIFKFSVRVNVLEMIHFFKDYMKYICLTYSKLASYIHIMKYK